MDRALSAGPQPGTWRHLVASGGTFDTGTGTCGGTCIQCCGWNFNSFYLGAAPGSTFGVADSSQYTLYGEDCSTPDQIAPVDTWSSYNSSVASIDTNGNATGMSAGATTIEADSSLYGGPPVQECSDFGNPSCPDGTPNATTGPATVVAPPTNFRQTSESASNGVLYFSYAWSSSSGNLSDLSSCHWDEQVTYQGEPQPSFEWPSPPYASGFTTDNPNYNPPNTPGPATDGQLNDMQTNVGFASPYAASDIKATQVYRWYCDNYEGGAWNNFEAAITIERTVSQNSNGTWKYLVTKSGYSASINPLP